MADSEDDSWEIIQPEASDIIRCVLVGQLHKATQIHTTAPFKIEGKAFKRFILVGNLYQFSSGPVSQTFYVTDGTGSIKASIWNDNIGGNKIAAVPGNKFPYFSMPYVRIVGELEVYRDLKTVRVHSVEPVNDPHEAYHHILQSIHDTLVYERGPPPKSSFSAVEEVQQSPEDTSSDGPLIVSPPASPFKRRSSGRTSITSPLQALSEETELRQGQNDQGQAPTTSGTISPSTPQIAIRTSSASSPGASAGRVTPGNNLPVTPKRSYVRSVSEPAPNHSANLSSPHTPPRQRRNTKAAPMSPTSPHTPPSVTRSSRQGTPRRDPYSHLSPLSRRILLCIQGAQADYEKEYGTTDGWNGVYFPVIFEAAKKYQPAIDIDTLTDDLMNSIDQLYDENIIFNIMDDYHYGCH